jgi:hypothetical protein
MTSLHPLWNRRFSTKFNGVGYVTQRAAEALSRRQEKNKSPLLSNTTWEMPPFFAALRKNAVSLPSVEATHHTSGACAEAPLELAGFR